MKESPNQHTLDQLLTDEVNKAVQKGSRYLIILGVIGISFSLIGIVMNWLGDFLLPFLVSLVGTVFIGVVHLMARRRMLGARANYFVVITFALIPTIFFLSTHFFYPYGAMTFVHGGFTYVYFFAIILSGSFFDFRLSVTTGLVCALGLLVCYIWDGDKLMEIQIPDNVLQSDFAQPEIFYLRAGFIALMGPAVGGLSIIAKRLMRRLMDEEEKRTEIQRLFGQQVSKEVVEELISKGEEFRSKKCHVTVMFMDIRDFTKFADANTPEEVASFQTTVFSELVDIVRKHQGIVNQMLGDGIMAIFGAPVETPNHQRDSLLASFEILETIELLGKSGKIPQIRAGIGLHSGLVVAGNVGNKIRQQYSITGTTVNMAARIEQLNKPFASELLISETVFPYLPEGMPSESLGKVELRGIEEPIEIFKLK